MMISQLLLGMSLPHLFLQVVLHLAFATLQFYKEPLVKRNVSSWRNTDVYFIPTLLYCTSLSLEWVFRCPLNATLHRIFCFLLWEHIWHCELFKNCENGSLNWSFFQNVTEIMSIVYFYLLCCRNPFWNLLSLQSQRLNLCFFTSAKNYRPVLFALVSDFFDYVSVAQSFSSSSGMLMTPRVYLSTCCLCWGIWITLGYLFFKKFCALFYVLDRMQQCLFVLCEIFAFSTTPRFSQHEAFHMKRRERDLLDSFSCLLVSRELHECNNREMDLSGAILVVLSLGAVVADLDLTVDAGSLLFRYSLPFKSLCYSAEFSFLNPISVRASQFLLKHGPDHFFSENKLAKELKVHTSEFRNFRNICSNAFKFTSVPGSPSRIRARYFLEEHKTAVLLFWSIKCHW